MQPKKKNPKTNKLFISKKYYDFIILALLVFLLYGNTLFNQYALDDHLVTDSPVILKGVKAIPEIFVTHYANTEGEFVYGYRPIVKSFFAIEYSIWGENPFLSHLVNILLYLAVCALLLMLFKRIFKRFHPLLPLLVTLLFAAHPVHTEVVASLKNRDEILSLMGALASTILIIKYIDTNRIKYLIIGLISFLFAYFSKPTCIPFIAIIPLILYFFTDIKFSKLIVITLLLLAITLLARYLPQLYLPSTFRPRKFYENNIRFEDIWTRIATGMNILLFYLKKLIYPFPLLYYYGYNMIPIVKFPDIRAILSVLFHGSILVYAIFRLRQKSIYSFVILFYLISIAMFTNIVRPAMGIVAERFLFTPSVAFSILLGLLAFRIFKNNPANINIPHKAIYKTVALVLIILIPYTTLTISRNRNWEDYFTLFSSDMKYLENSVRANVLYAGKVKDNLKRGLYRPEEKNQLINLTLKHYKQALTLYPKNDVIWNNLASVYNDFIGDNEKAIQCLKKAIEIRPDKPWYYVNLGATYYNSNKFDASRECLEKCLEIDPAFNKARFLLSGLYLEKNEPELAIKINNEIIKVDSLSDKAFINLGDIYIQLGDTALAIKNWETAVYKNPGNINICKLLNGYYVENNNPEKARYYQILATKPKKNQ
jgi:tetratricopeptide (TPR) repeat protein